MKNVRHFGTYRKSHVVVIQHTRGSSLVRTRSKEYKIVDSNDVVLGSDIDLAHSATPIMDELFTHQKVKPTNDSLRFLKGRAT